MHPDPITSVSNPFVKRVRKLRHRKFREAEGVFLVEGIAQVRQAIDNHAPIESLLVAPDLLSSEGAWSEIERSRADGKDVVYLGREAFESIVERDHPSGLAATVRIIDRPLTDLAASGGDVFVALLDVGNPGNLGSIIRTVDAAGAQGVVIVGESTDQFHPVSVKASMGTQFRVPIYRTGSVEDLIAWTMMENVTLATTSVRADTLLWDAEFPTPLLLLFGSETHGLPQEVLERGSVSVAMPMDGVASSLNLAVSVGVVLYELRRRLA